MSTPTTTTHGCRHLEDGVVECRPGVLEEVSEQRRKGVRYRWHRGHPIFDNLGRRGDLDKRQRFEVVRYNALKILQVSPSLVELVAGTPKLRH